MKNKTTKKYLANRVIKKTVLSLLAVMFLFMSCTAEISSSSSDDITTVSLATVPQPATQVRGDTTLTNNPGEITVSWAPSSLVDVNDQNTKETVLAKDGNALKVEQIEYKVYYYDPPGDARWAASNVKEAAITAKQVVEVEATNTSTIIKVPANGEYYMVVEAINATDTTKTTLSEVSDPVTVTSLKGNATELLSFSILGASATIVGVQVAVTVPLGTNLNTLTPEFTVSEGARVTVGDVDQTSGQTSNNFTNSVNYTITAEDGTSNEIYTVTVTESTSAATAPGAVTDLAASVTATNSITVTWSKVDVTVGKKADGNTLVNTDVLIEVYYSSDITHTTAADIIANGITHTTTYNNTHAEATLTGLTPNTEYNIVLKLTNNTDTSTPKISSNSNVVSVSTLSAATAPGAVDNLAVGSGEDARSLDSITITWSYIIQGSEKKADGSQLEDTDVLIEVYYSSTHTTATDIIANGTKLVLATPLTNANTEASITGLTPNTEYNIVLKQTNLSDTTKISYSNILSARTFNNVAELLSFSILGASATIVGVQVAVTVPLGTNLNTLTPEFTVSEGARVTVGDVDQISGQTSNNFTSPVNYTITAEDGTSNEIYTVTVTESTSAATALGAVTDLAGSSVTAPTTTGLTVMWSAFTLGAGDKKADGSQLEDTDVLIEVYYSSTHTTATDIIANGTKLVLATPLTNANTEASITGLTPNTEYNIVLKLTNNTDTSTPKISSNSNVVSVSTFNAATAPGKVTGLAAGTGITASIITVTWTALTLTAAEKKVDGTQLEDTDVLIEVYYSSTHTTATDIIANGTQFTPAAPLTNANTEATLTGLTPHTEYNIVLKSTNNTDTSIPKVSSYSEVFSVSTVSIPITSLTYGEANTITVLADGLINESPVLDPVGAGTGASYAVISEQLPDWLTLENDGRLVSAQATAGTETVSVHTFSIEVTGMGDYAGETAEAAITIRVEKPTVSLLRFVKSNNGNGNVDYYGDGVKLPNGVYSEGGIFHVEVQAQTTGGATATITYSVPANNGVLSINDASQGIVSILKAGGPIEITARSANDTDPADIDTTSVFIIIERKSLAETDLEYPSISGTIGTAITPTLPSKQPLAAAGIRYTATLPEGLGIDEGTGEITGTLKQNAETGTKDYEIVAQALDTTNTDDDYYQGSISINVSITVNTGKYTTVEFIDGGGTAITTLGKTYLDAAFNLIARTTPVVANSMFTFSVQSGTSVTLAEDPTTGNNIKDKATIVGTADNTVIEVTVSALGYETKTATLPITVAKKILTDADLSYSPNSISVEKGTAIRSIPTPTVTPLEAATGASYEITSVEALPDDLILAANGNITGTVANTVQEGTNDYTITMTPAVGGNFEGSASSTVSIEVSGPGLQGVNFDQTGPIENTYGDADFTVSATPSTSSGVTATIRYTVSANNGILEIPDTAVGTVKIIGTGTTTITATAENSADPADTKTATIQVMVHKKEVSLSYDSTDITATRTEAIDITTNPLPVPTLTPAGAQVRYTVAPSLPTWLTLNADGTLTTTTPDTVLNTTTYTITATGEGNYTGTAPVAISITVNELNKILGIKFVDKHDVDITETIETYYEKHFIARAVAIISGDVDYTIEYERSGNIFIVNEDIGEFTNGPDEGNITATVTNNADSTNTVSAMVNVRSVQFPVEEGTMWYDFDNVQANSLVLKLGESGDNTNLEWNAERYGGFPTGTLTFTLARVVNGVRSEIIPNGENRANIGGYLFEFSDGSLNNESSGSRVLEEEYVVTATGVNNSIVSGGSAEVTLSFRYYGVESVKFTQDGTEGGTETTEHTMTSGTTFNLRDITYAKYLFEDPSNLLDLSYVVSTEGSSTTVSPTGIVTAGDSGAVTTITVTAKDTEGEYVTNNKNENITRTATITITVQ